MVETPNSEVYATSDTDSHTGEDGPDETFEIVVSGHAEKRMNGVL
jgi:hypothetical protein